MKTFTPILSCDSLWAGSTSGLWDQVSAERVLQKQMAQGLVVSGQKDDQHKDHNRLLEVLGGIGIVSIRGALVNEASWANPFLGRTGYPEIREAMIQAASDSSIKLILMHVESGGGMVSGMLDTADLIAEVRKVKPVYSFTDGTMASAAYALGSSAQTVYAARGALVGSVGAMSVLREFSKQLKDDGVGVKVLRKGRFKALANSFEKLSDLGEQVEQEKLDALGLLLDQLVAANRGTTVQIVQERMGEGREFIGEAARIAGLVDEIITFDKLMSRLQDQLLDTKSFPTNNSVTPNKGFNMPRAFTEQELAALQAGGTVPSVQSQAPAAPEASSAPTLSPVAPEQTAETTQAATSPATTAPAASVPAAPAAGSEVVALLQGQLSTAQASLLKAQVAEAQLQSQLDALKASLEPLVKIASGSLSNMRVALSLAPVDLSASKPEEVVAEHARAVEMFNKQFRAGGVASAPTQQAATNEQKRPAWLRQSQATKN